MQMELLHLVDVSCNLSTMTSEQPHVFIALLLCFLFLVFVGAAVSLFTGIFMPTSVFYSQRPDFE